MLPKPLSDTLKLITGFVCAYLCVQTGYANDTVALPPIVVNAPAKSVSSLIQDTESLDQDDITRLHQRSIADVLQGSRGFTFTRYGGVGQPGASFIRGAGGQGVLTLDGIPILQTVPGSQVTHTLPSEAIQSAEINRGPSSAYHAFQPLGGSVHLSTFDREETGGRLSVEGGSFGILRETLQAGLAGDAGRITATLTRSDAFDGTHAANSFNYPERDKYGHTQGIVRFTSDLTEDLNWQGSMLYRQSKTGADKFGVDKLGRVELQDESNNFGREETWLAQNKLTLAVTDTWESQLQLGYTQSATSVTAGSRFNSVFSRLFLANWRNRHKLFDNPTGNHQINLYWGGQARYEQGKSPTSGLGQHRRSLAGFIDTEFNYGDFSGEAGVRVEDFDRYGTHPLFHTAAAWQISPKFKLRASGGTGYRLPAYTEMWFLFFGNALLKPERAASGQLGFEWNPNNNLHLTANGFYHHYQDLISIAYEPFPDLNPFKPNSPYDPQPKLGPVSANIKNASVMGFEISGDYIWHNGLDTGFSYTFSDSRDRDNHKQLPLRPSHSLKLWQEWRVPETPLTLRLETLYRNRTWNDFANTLPVKDSVQINAILRYRINPQLEAYLRGENLTDNRHPAIFGVDMPGASVFGGFQADF
jgi:outer membrane cobalamin receptor